MTCTFASGEVGPLVVMYGNKHISDKDLLLVNERYAPEVITVRNSKKSHMYDSQLFLWYLDVVFREALQQQRRANTLATMTSSNPRCRCTVPV